SRPSSTMLPCRRMSNALCVGRSVPDDGLGAGGGTAARPLAGLVGAAGGDADVSGPGVTPGSGAEGGGTAAARCRAPVCPGTALPPVTVVAWAKVPGRVERLAAER